MNFIRYDDHEPEITGAQMSDGKDSNKRFSFGDNEVQFKKFLKDIRDKRLGIMLGDKPVEGLDSAGIYRALSSSADNNFTTNCLEFFLSLHNEAYTFPEYFNVQLQPVYQTADKSIFQSDIRGGIVEAVTSSTSLSGYKLGQRITSTALLHSVCPKTETLFSQATIVRACLIALGLDFKVVDNRFMKCDDDVLIEFLKNKTLNTMVPHYVGSLLLEPFNIRNSYIDADWHIADIIGYNDSLFAFHKPGRSWIPELSSWKKFTNTYWREYKFYYTDY